MRAQTESLGCGELSFASDESSEDGVRKPVRAPCFDEAEFRAFYEKTAPALRGYLRRVSGDPSLADDLLQESYLRLLRAPLAPTEEAHRKHYLFRVATNLLRDHFRAAKRSFAPLPEVPSGTNAAHDFELASDLGQFLLELKPRERELLWLAYVEGYRHDEIAKFMGCRTASIRPMLFRARGRLVELLRVRGWKRNSQGEATP
ncbi:MAG: RNA polymerase sigma factor [Candidatus Acidiferrales bacterium]